MNIALDDIVPISQARSRLTQLADEVASQGTTKLLTRNGVGYVALVPAAQVDELQRFRADQHLAQLRAIAMAMPEIQEKKGTSAGDFRAEVNAFIRKNSSATGA